MHDILDMMPESIKQNKAKTILPHLSEAWVRPLSSFTLLDVSLTSAADSCFRFSTFTAMLEGEHSLEGSGNADCD
jgi:hypothetical protein